MKLFIKPIQYMKSETSIPTLSIDNIIRLKTTIYKNIGFNSDKQENSPWHH